MAFGESHLRNEEREIDFLLLRNVGVNQTSALNLVNDGVADFKVESEASVTASLFYVLLGGL